MKKIRKAVLIFDLDDTLIPTSEFAMNARKSAIRAMLQNGLADKLRKKHPRLGYEDIEKELFQKLLGIIKEKGSNFSKHFDVLIDRLVKEKRIKLLKNEKIMLVVSAINAYHATKGMLMAYPDVPLALNQLIKNYDLFLATEGVAKKQWDKIIRTGLNMFFSPSHVFVVSSKIGKSERFYRKVIEKIGVPANMAVMVGDKEEKDIVIPKRVGMKAIRICRNGISKTNSMADALLQDLFQLDSVIQNIIKEK